MNLFELLSRSVRGSAVSSGRSCSRVFGRRTTHFIQSASSTILAENTFRKVLACARHRASFQNARYGSRRSFTSHAIDHSENLLDDPPHPVAQSESPSPSACTAAAEPMCDDAENELSLPDNDAESTASEEMSEDEASQRKAHAEKEFFDVIEVEESPDELLSMLLRLEHVLPPNDSKVCRTCLRLAILCNDTNQKPEKVVDYARQAFHNFDSSKFPLESATALFLVGMGYYRMGDSKEAVSALEKCAFQMESLELPCTQKAELTLLQCNCQFTLGQARVSLGWNVEGLSDIRMGLAAMKKALPPEDARLANCYQEAALSFLRAKEPNEALRSCRKAISVFSRSLGPYCSHVADIKSLMSKIHFELGDCESALCECQQAVQILKSLGEINKAMRIDLESMQAYFLLGKFDKAISKLNEFVKTTKEDDPLHVEALILLARALINQEDETAAAEYSQRALNFLDQNELNFDLATALVRLAMCFQQLGNFDHAITISQRAFIFFEKCAEAEAADYAADARGYRGSLLFAIGKLSEALLDLEKALELKQSIYGLESVELLDVCNHLGVAHAHAGNVDKALAVLQDAKSILNATNMVVNLTSIHIYNNLALAFILADRTKEARESKRHAVCMIRKAGKEILLSADETEKELENLIKAKESGMAGGISKQQILKQMLPTCVTS